MNLQPTLLICVAILIAVLTIGFLVLWWKGVELIALPGLGLIIAIPFIVVVLLVIEMAIVLVATLAK